MGGNPRATLPLYDTMVCIFVCTYICKCNMFVQLLLSSGMIVKVLEGLSIYDILQTLHRAISCSVFNYHC